MRLIRVLSLTTILLFLVGAELCIGQPSSKGKNKIAQLKPVVGRALKMVESAPLSSLAVSSSVTGEVDSRVRAGENGSEVNELNTEVERTPVKTGGSVDGALQTSGKRTSANMPAPLFTFEGLADVDNLGLVNPPDTNGDVGPNHYVEIVNDRVRVFDKTGAPLTPPFLLSSLFAPLGGICSTQDNGDPIALYDRIANRWLLSQFAFITTSTPPFHECIAISRSGDPMGKYYLYDFVTPGNSFPDYPKLAVWSDGYYMTSRQFNPSFNGHGAFAFDRAKMLAGDSTASFIYFNVPFAAVSNSSSGMLPSEHSGILPPPPGSPNVFAIYTSDEFGDPQGDAIRLFNFHADFTTPASSSFTERPESPLSVAAFDPRNPPGRADIEEPSPGENIDTIGDRLMHRLFYRNRNGTESLVATHTVNVSGQDGSTSANHQAGIRYYELRRTSPAGPYAVYDQGTFSPDSGNGTTGTNRWMGSAAIDNDGNLAVGFSASSTSLLPSINYAGRAFNELGGLLQGEVTMFAGLGTMTASGNRWGDYTSLSVDPADDCTFWHANEYWPTGNTSFNWHTRIGSFRFPVCTTPQQGILKGKVTSCNTGGPLSDSIVNASGGPSDGFSSGTDSSGNYSISLAPGNYIAGATNTFRKCNENPTQNVSIANGGVTTANFCISGDPKVILGTVAINDSGGNNNGVINLNECVAINVTLRNDGCKIAKKVSAILSTTTPGVKVKQASSNFPDIQIDTTGTNLTPFRIETSPSFACGTPIDFTLTVKSSSPTTTLTFSLPTCAGGASQSISGTISAGDLTTVAGRLGRNGIASACDPAKGCPGTLGTTPRRYDSFTFSNAATVPACLTVNLTSVCGGNILGSAYLNSFDPSNQCTNYLGDAGGSGSSVSFSAKVPAGQNMILLVTEVVANIPDCSYNATVTGFYDFTPDGGACP